jgi:hypothetical protein
MLAQKIDLVAGERGETVPFAVLPMLFEVYKTNCCHASTRKDCMQSLYVVRTGGSFGPDLYRWSSSQLVRRLWNHT